MRLIKLLSILLCIVLFIGLCSFSVSAQIEGTTPLENGWYTFGYADFLNLLINNGYYTLDNIVFPYSYSTHWLGVWNLDYFSCEFVLDPTRFINVPDKHTLQIEADFVYQNTHTSSYLSSITNLSDYGFSFDIAEYENAKYWKGSYKKIETPAEYVTQYEYMYTATAQVQNSSGSDYKFQSFRFLLDSGFLPDNHYRLFVSQIRFRVLDESQANVNSITNGWTANPQKPSGSDKVNQQTQLEEQIKNDTAAGRQETNDILNSAPSIIGNYTNGFLFLMGLFGLATDIPLLDSLLNISLAMGLFIFFLNLVPSIVSSVQRSSNKKRGG